MKRTRFVMVASILITAFAEKENESDSSIVKELYLIYTGIVLCVLIATCVYFRKNWTSTIRILNASQGWGNKYAPVSSSDPDQEKALGIPPVGVTVPTSIPPTIKGQTLAPAVKK